MVLLLLGWSSNSRYALLGGLRAAAQFIAYDVVMGLILINLLLVGGSTDLERIIQFQEHVWFIFPFPLLFVLFFVCTVAETSRGPFDLPEAEGELVARL